jgi:phenylalanyl-tRNA synthetase beta subunit
MRRLSHPQTHADSGALCNNQCEFRVLTNASVSGRICVKPTDENARSKALDRAARYYLRMCGGVAAYGRDDIQTLLDEAEAQGSLTAPEIAAILDERELPVTYETTSSVGPE